MRFFILLLVPWALLGLSGCDGEDGSSDAPAPILPPDSVTVTALNYDATPYRLVVQSYDSSVWPLAVMEQVIADPLPAFADGSPGQGGAAVTLAASSPSMQHYFALRDPSTDALLSTSVEYVKGPGYQVATLVVSGQAITVP